MGLSITETISRTRRESKFREHGPVDSWPKTSLNKQLSIPIVTVMAVQKDLKLAYTSKLYSDKARI